MLYPCVCSAPTPTKLTDSASSVAVVEWRAALVTPGQGHPTRVGHAHADHLCVTSRHGRHGRHTRRRQRRDHSTSAPHARRPARDWRAIAAARRRTLVLSPPAHPSSAAAAAAPAPRNRGAGPRAQGALMRQIQVARNATMANYRGQCGQMGA